MCIKPNIVALAEEMAAAQQPESIPLIEPFMESLERWTEIWPEGQAELLATVSGLWLTGLHAVLLKTGRVDLPEQRAWLNEALDEVETILAGHSEVVRLDEYLIHSKASPELC